jgi:polyisoprenyl-teichoic acid--peptidoglycan teichoic acid transferase
MIASIKPNENEAALISIPRDLYVQIPELGIATKINAVKTISEINRKDGNRVLKQIIEEISGLKIQYYVQLDFKGFTKIIDDIGGIDIELVNDINDPTYPNFNNGYDPFYITKGWHHLDGATALKVARSRHSKMGDFDRIIRQQAVMRSFKQKINEKYSILDIFALKNILIDLGDHLNTDIKLKEIPRFYSILKNVKNHKITAESIDTKKYLDRTYVGLGYTLESKSKDYSEIKNLSKDIFDIDTSDDRKKSIKDEAANIEIQNGTGSLDLANTVAQDLEKFGLRIINSTNIDTPAFSGAQIYDNSNDLKPETLKLLKEKFAATIIDNYKRINTKADFTVILGSGF